MKNRIKTLFLVSSFAEAPILLDKLKDTNFYIIIIFDSYDLYKFILKLGFDSKKIHYVKKVNQSISKPLNYFKARKYYLAKIKELKNLCNDVDDIHCFHIFGNLFCFKLIYEVLNNVKNIYIYECIKFNEMIEIFQYPEWFARHILVKFLYGKGSKITVTPHKYLESFNIKKFGQAAKIISFYDCQQIRKDSPIASIFNYEHDYTCIFFDQPIVNYGRTTEEEYLKFMKNIREIFLEEISNNKFCVKLHPGNHSDLRFYEGLHIIPSYIPSECLNINKDSLWLAISSSTLWINNQAKKIALINLLDFKSNKTKEYIRKSVVMNFDNNVFIPKDLTDLKNFFIKNK